MVQTDYIMRMIEELAAFLWAIIFNKKIQNYDLALIKINEAYNSLLHLNPDEIKYLTVNEILLNNTHNNILLNDNIEIIANLFFQEADVLERKNVINETSLEYYQKSLELFLILHDTTANNKYCVNINEIIIKLENYNLENRIILKIHEYYLKIELFGKAEDKLYELLENKYPDIENKIISFYKYLLNKDNDILEKGNLPRNEITDALNEINTNYSY